MKKKKKTRKVIIDIEQDPIILKSELKKKKKTDLILVPNNQHDSLTQKSLFHKNKTVFDQKRYVNFYIGFLFCCVYI